MVVDWDRSGDAARLFDAVLSYNLGPSLGFVRAWETRARALSGDIAGAQEALDVQLAGGFAPLRQPDVHFAPALVFSAQTAWYCDHVGVPQLCGAARAATPLSLQPLPHDDGRGGRRTGLGMLGMLEQRHDDAVRDRRTPGADLHRLSATGRVAASAWPYPVADADSERARRGGQAMSGGLAALLDDVAVLARAAAASVDDVAAGAGRASVKAAGVIVDDTAVTPRYLEGFTPERELPMIKRIAVGSLRNKLLFILPAALLLSELLEWALTPILMIGGAYLCYEATEKLWESVGPQRHHAGPAAGTEEPANEEELVGGAIRTDFILSAEIMVISLNEVADESLLSRALILVVVAFAITAVVYGAVSLIVKMDDVGLRLAQTGKGAAAAFGRGMVRAMPVVLSVLSMVGIAAMLWVGGHILLVGLDELGFSWLYDQVKSLEEDVHDALGTLGGVGKWLTNTIASAILGVAVGAVIVAVMHRRGGGATGH